MGESTERTTRAVITIRRAVESDAERFAHLHLDCWDEAYAGLVPQDLLDARRADLVAAIERRRSWIQAGTQIHVAEDVTARELVGMAIAGPGRDDDIDLDWELQALYVRASHYGTALGIDLMRAAIGDRPAYLWVLQGNARATAFYAKHRFVPDGTVVDEPEGPHVRLVRRPGA